MAPLLPGSDRIMGGRETQRWSVEALVVYFEETSVDLLDGTPESNFYRLTPAQCAGYLLYLSRQNGKSPAEAWYAACHLKAVAADQHYRHWYETVEILRSIQPW